MKRLKFLCLFTIFALALSAAFGCSGGQDAEQPSDDDDGVETIITIQEAITAMYVTINGSKLEVTLEDNSSASALAELLKQGDITYTADDYGDFEKVGDIGCTLPRNDSYITTEPGDVILYQGRNICLYYGVNSYTFTKIGKINGYTETELRGLLNAGGGETQVTLSLD